MAELLTSNETLVATLRETTPIFVKGFGGRQHQPNGTPSCSA